MPQLSDIALQIMIILPWTIDYGPWIIIIS